MSDIKTDMCHPQYVRGFKAGHNCGRKRGRAESARRILALEAQLNRDCLRTALRDLLWAVVERDNRNQVRQLNACIANAKDALNRDCDVPSEDRQQPLLKQVAEFVYPPLPEPLGQVFQPESKHEDGIWRKGPQWSDWQDVPLVVLGQEATATVSIPPQKSLPPDMKAALISGVNELVDSVAEESNPQSVNAASADSWNNGYLCLWVRDAAKKLIDLTMLWSEGHYPHSNAKVMPDNHPLARALAALAELDKDICAFANEKHDPSLFAPYVPSIQEQTRWNKYAGEPDQKNPKDEK